MVQTIYIASPYTIGDQAKNVRLQIEAANILMDLGYLPFTPLLSHFQHMIFPRSYDSWINYDKGWIDRCDILIRLKPLDKNGIEIPSNGADIEESHARLKGKSVYVFNTLEQLKAFSPF